MWIAVVAVLAGMSAVASGAYPTVVTLQYPDGYYGSTRQGGISDSGQNVSSSITWGAQVRGFRWKDISAVSRQLNFGGNKVYQVGINSVNNEGMAAGVTYFEWRRQATYWPHDSPNSPIGLPDPPGTWLTSEAYQMNNLGEIVGRVGNSNTNDYQGMKWSADGTTVTPFVNGGGSGWHWASDINDASVAVGFASFASAPERRIVKWLADGTLVDLTTPVQALSGGSAQAISPNGTIVGFDATSSGSFGFVLRPDDSVNWFNFASMGRLIQVHDVNDAGMAVGRARDGNNVDHGFLWDTNANTVTPLIDLVDPADGWTYMGTGFGISADGKILSRGTRNGTDEAIVIIPEPTVVAGDANKDGVVDDADLSLLLAHWDQDVTGDPDGGWGKGEFNGVAPVQDSDLSLLLANWTVTGSVPEPATLCILAAGGLVLSRRRR